MSTTTTRDDIEINLKNLQEWLATHTPRTDWLPGQVQAYNDRLNSLAMWLAKSQIVERGRQ